MLNIQRILCPVDFSDPSSHAIEQAVQISQWYGSQITALHVVQPLPPGVSRQDEKGTLTGERAELARLRTELEHACRRARDAGISLVTLVQCGSIVGQILDCAAGLPADLIVIGTHGLSGFEHMVLGSVTEKVLRKATCPVLTVPPRTHATSSVPFKRLLCPVDFSASSAATVRVALSLAQEADATITFLHVIEWPWEEPPAPVLAELPAEEASKLAAFRRLCEERAAVQLQALVPDEVRSWCPPITRLAHGKPYVQILRSAAEDHADLIVLGVAGRSALELAMLGSTTNQVVRRAMCPVLTVRTPTRHPRGESPS